MENVTIKIMAFGRGFVIAARTKDLVESELMGHKWYHVPRAYTVRRWGTNNGLGELAAQGPLSETILDAIPFGIHVPLESVHGVWDVNPKVDGKFEKAFDKADKEILK